MGGKCSKHGMRKAYKILVGDHSEDNIKINHTEMRRGVEWIHLAHDTYQWRALTDTIMNLRGP